MFDIMQRKCKYSLLTFSDCIYVLDPYSHLSERSAKLSALVIDALAPDCVVVELCRSRTALLMSDSTKALGLAATSPSTSTTAPNGSDLNAYLSSLLRSLSLGGNSAMLLRLLLQKKLDQYGFGEQGREVINQFGDVEQDHIFVMFHLLLYT